MATQLQLRRDTAADLVSVPPAEGEPGYDQTNKRLLVGDGARNQGIPHASFRDMHGQTFAAAVAGGTADALTLDLTDGTLNYNPSAYAKFQRFVFEAAADNTGAATLAVGGLSALAIKKYASGSKAALGAGDLVDGFVYEVVHDGTEFVLGGSSLGGGSRTIISRTDVSSAVASVDLTGLGDSGYDAFEIIVSNLRPATDGVSLYLRSSTDGGSSFDAGGSDYSYTTQGAGNNGAVNHASSAGTSQIQLNETTIGNAAGESGWSGTILALRPADTVRSLFTWQFAQIDTGGDIRAGHGGGQRESAADVDALRLLFSSGNIAAGAVLLVGIRNA